MPRVTLAILATVTLIIFAVILVITLARGYEFDPTSKEFKGNGILVATSDPNGAEVLINGKLKTATNNSINLPPDTYDIKIQLDGYSSWEKRVEIKKEEVFKTNVFLFPRVPDLRPLTLTGALNPTLSPDQSKIAFGVASASAQRSGIWVADMGKSALPGPLGSSADMKLIFRNFPGLDLSQAKFLWSPDSKQLLTHLGDRPPTIATPSGQVSYLLDTDRLNETLEILSTSEIQTLLTEWQALSKRKFDLQMQKIPPPLSVLLSTSSANIQFSPDENKILYEATSSANLPKILKTYIPGLNPTAQTRTLTPSKIYVYDLKEDTNYEITDCEKSTVNCTWFPSSRHLLSFTDKQISIMEYDGTNKSILYSGPFVDAVVYAWPNWSKVVILTSLNSAIGENLYTINLR